MLLLLEWAVITLGSSELTMFLLFDYYSLVLLMTVLSITILVLKYSYFYMKGDKYMNRFVLLVILFVISMVLMVSSPSVFSILLGWDGLGLMSYLLIIYYSNSKSASAGMLTILCNRVGDVAIVSVIGVSLCAGSWNLIFYDTGWACLLIAALTKSAQLPFSSWLPAAMAAPTPVSALVHSSTLVTAGVYLLIRLNSSSLHEFLMYVSIMTMTMSAIMAIFEYDMKKIIALSTLSQLGVMMFSISLGEVDMAFFHLITHALFKSLLFLCAGYIIYNMGGNQDMRFMGSVTKSLPVTSSLTMLSVLALCGLPFMAGFYSKDLIIESFFCSVGMSIVVYALLALATACTLGYSLLFIGMLSCAKWSSGGLISLGSQESYSMVVLGVLSLFVGPVMMWMNLPIMVSSLFGISSMILMGFIMLIPLLFNYLVKWYMATMWFSSLFFIKMTSTYSLTMLEYSGGPMLMGSLKPSYHFIKNEFMIYFMILLVLMLLL